METASTCKYYVTKLLGIGPPKPNCVYDVRSGNVRDRESKSLFRVFYRSHGRRRKHRNRVGAECPAAGPHQESYVPSPANADQAGARICDGGVGRALEDDTVEDIEKKFQGFRNVFEKCKVKKKKKKPTLFNVTSGLRFTLVANTMLHMDDPKTEADGDAEGAVGVEATDEAAATVVIAEDGEDGDLEDREDGDEDEAEEEEEEEEVERNGAGRGGGGHLDDDDDDDDDDEEEYHDVVDDVQTAVIDCSSDPANATTKCPKDVADKVNSWIDSSSKQTDYSEEESIFVCEENVQPRGAVPKYGDPLRIVKGGTTRHSYERKQRGD